MLKSICLDFDNFVDGDILDDHLKTIHPDSIKHIMQSESMCSFKTRDDCTEFVKHITITIIYKE